MNGLRRFIDKIKPNFEKGGKLHFLYSTFEGFETLLFVPDKVTFKGAHIRDGIDMKRTMAVVVMALIPAVLFGMYNAGHQYYLSVGESSTFLQTFWFGFLKIFPIIVVSYVVGLGIEFAFAQMRGHEINEGFLVTGMLIPMVLPVDTPLWMVAVATAFSVIIGKEVFGGTGMNIWNPALIARAFLFFAYPKHMSGNTVWVADMQVNGLSGATPLAEAAAGNAYPGTADLFFGLIPGSIGETSTFAILLGAIVLLYTGVGSWKIMSTFFAGGLIMGIILNLFAVNPFMEVSPWDHLFMGGFAFGAVFMATDPVSASQTELGKYIYGFLGGLLAILIRVLNPAYPEGVMLAILFMNTFAPLIDHYIVQGNIKRRLKRQKVNA